MTMHNHPTRFRIARFALGSLCLAVVFGVSACKDNRAATTTHPPTVRPPYSGPPFENPPPVDETVPYVPPAPVQLDPPVGLEIDGPSMGLNARDTYVDHPVAGDHSRSIRFRLGDSVGRRTIELAFPEGRASIPIADLGYYVVGAGVSTAAGDIMACWNTLTGETSQYSPVTPDPALGMALHCRMIFADGELGPTTRIRVPTVGCWISGMAVRPDGAIRVLWKGDDGWFDHRHENPLHGTYDAIFVDDVWSAPRLFRRVPNTYEDILIPQPGEGGDPDAGEADAGVADAAAD